MSQPTRVRVRLRVRVTDGSVTSSGWRHVPLVDRMGPWGVTAFLDVQWDVVPGRYQVTHLPTGYGAFTWGSLTLRQARRALRQFAALPDQARWRRLKNPRHMTKAMRAAGKALVAQIDRGAT